jgi:hypothetical protein
VPDVTVSTDIDSFLKSANKASARSALNLSTTPQVASFSANTISFDASVSPNATVQLSADATTLTISNASVGDSGLIEITQDATGGYVLNLAAGELVLAGDPADIASITPSTGVGTLGWYKHDTGGSDLYLYISDVT